jgi:hypothetical protein
MMIMDLNQVMLANLLMQIGNHTNAELNEGMVRHMVLNTIRMLNSRHRTEYGQLVIATDSTSWRKEVFPYYKANRKKKKDESELDWPAIFNIMETIKSELREFFPYPVVSVRGAEADDIIATLVKDIRLEIEPTLILSGDKDFVQLHKYPNVKQYDPTRKKFIDCKSAATSQGYTKAASLSPENFLAEHILRGDSGDGVPNVLSPDNCLVIGERQKAMTAKRTEALLAGNLNEMDPEYLARYKRNMNLIDLEYIPVPIIDAILDDYENQVKKPKHDLLNYFISRRLKNLLSSIGDF